jgi:hypothetical protein
LKWYNGSLEQTDAGQRQRGKRVNSIFFMKTTHFLNATPSHITVVISLKPVVIPSLKDEK